jgi:hypothetical protein
MMVTYGRKHVASHKIKHDVFDDKYFIILVLSKTLSLFCIESWAVLLLCIAFSVFILIYFVSNGIF